MPPTTRFTTAIAVGVLALATFAVAGCSGSRASVPTITDRQSVTEITSCGVVISTPGAYGVSQPLTSDSLTADCIEIAASGVNLGLSSSVTLSGPGRPDVTAAGINIAAGVNGVLVSVPGVTIRGFGVGIHVAGSGVSISGSPTSFTISGNAAQGVLVSGTNSVVIDSLTSEQNGASGLEVLSSSGVILKGLNTLQDNAGYGLWVHSSSVNQFFNADAFTNQKGGIFVGELKSDNLPAGHNNVVVGAGVVQNQGAGMEIGLGDSNNVVTVSAGESNAGMDAVDENANCGTNT
jgi:hypothetical protein